MTSDEELELIEILVQGALPEGIRVVRWAGDSRYFFFNLFREEDVAAEKTWKRIGTVDVLKGKVHVGITGSQWNEIVLSLGDPKLYQQLKAFLAPLKEIFWKN